MVSRGVQQLKHLRLYFCDFGGSSAGVRSLMHSQDLVNFMEKHEDLTLEISMKRNQHPYVSATYVNGFVKDIPLRNIEESECLSYMNKATKQFGRGPLANNDPKIAANGTSFESNKPTMSSIQGMWGTTLWNQYPQHMMEPKIEIDFSVHERAPMRPILEKKVRTHHNVRLTRQKTAIVEDHTV